MSNSVLISGVLVDAVGKPITDRYIEFRSIKTSTSVLKGIVTIIPNANDGSYSQMIAYGSYAVFLCKKTEIDIRLGEVTITNLTTPKSINELLLNREVPEEIITPDLLAQFKAERTKSQEAATGSVTSAANAKESESKAQSYANQAKTNLDKTIELENNAKTSATNAKNSENNAKSSELASKQSENNSKNSELASKGYAESIQNSEATTTAILNEAKTVKDDIIATANEIKNAESNIETIKGEINTITSGLDETQSKIEAINSSVNAIDQNIKDSAAKIETSVTNAKNSENNAVASSVSAKTSEDNAKKSADKALVSENNSKTSADKAQEYAAIASSGATSVNASLLATQTSANNAKASATSSENFKNTAKSYSDNAATFADNAKKSEIKSQTYADDVKASETKVKELEGSSQTAQTNAKASEVASKTSETNAKTSEDNAALSAEKAKTSEENAKISEDGAQVSAINAKESEDLAQQYANEAKLSATSGNTILGNIQSIERTIISKSDHVDLLASDVDKNAQSAKLSAEYSLTNANNSKKFANDAQTAASSINQIDTSQFFRKNGEDTIPILIVSNGDNSTVRLTDAAGRMAQLRVWSDGGFGFDRYDAATKMWDVYFKYNPANNSWECLHDTDMVAKGVSLGTGTVPYKGFLNKTNLGNLGAVHWGVYVQNLGEEATFERSYPINAAGSLVVLPTFAAGPEGCVQIYTSYTGGRQFIRNYIGDSASGHWEPWIEQITTANIHQFVPIGDQRLMPFRANELPYGWYLMNGDNYLLNSPQGNVLNKLSNAYKSDYGITIKTIENQQYINVPSMFASDGRGYFERAVNGVSRQVGSWEIDAIRNIYGQQAVRGNVDASLDTSGPFTPYTYVFGYGRGKGDQPIAISDPNNLSPSVVSTFDTSKVVLVANENRPVNIGKTPAIHLGV